ncbi:MAG: hypothetical protein ACRDN9_04885 [Streptosporangiaceae bacterium]
MTCGIDHAALAALRAAFPRWGVVHDVFARRFVAVCGRHEVVVAGDPAELRTLLLERAARQSVGPPW